MFSEEQINGYKNTHPSPELRERIMTSLEENGKKPFYLRMNFARYGAVAAAFAVVIISLFLVFGKGDADLVYEGEPILSPTEVTVTGVTVPVGARSAAVEGVTFELENRGKCTVKADCGELCAVFGGKAVTAEAGEEITVKGDAELIWNPCTSEDAVCRLTVAKGDELTVYEVRYDSRANTYTVSP